MCAILALFLWRVEPRAQTGPVPPCGMESVPAYPELGAASVEKFWRPADVSKDWKMPACAGWTRPGFSTLVTTAARFHYAGGADSLLRRIGAISELAGVRYWSPTHNKWQTLILEATALAGPNAKPVRADFTPDEIRYGDSLYFQQADNLLGKAIYRMRVVESSADRIVFSVENVGAMRYLLFTLFDAGEMQSIHFLDRESPDVWRYYGLVRSGERTSGLVTARPSSSINRAVAFYRHYAGIPTDQEPPGAPHR
jgi:hypothetical protein